ncbi:hypothetical protein JW935_07135 [candidate division KSB1 bacterium]|nr:hypothetical protein [candidate division KSB1 bacterium]
MSIFSKKTRPKLNGKIGLLNLENWHLSLSELQQEKVKNYSGEGDELTTKKISNTSQSQKHFLWCVASDAFFQKDYKFALLIAQQAFKFNGNYVDDHFLYNTIIESYHKINDNESAKKFCFEEISRFNQIGPELKHSFKGRFPISMPAMDYLLKYATDDEDYDEAVRLIDIFEKNGLIDNEEAERRRLEFRNKLLYDKAYIAIENEDIDKAVSLFDQIVSNDSSEGASVYKILGNYFLENDREIEAYDFYKKSILADPEIKGVKTKLQKIAKRNKLPVDFLERLS